MQRLDDAFAHGADVSIVHDVVRELMEEKRASRQVTVSGGDAGKSDGAGRQLK
ncbi:YcjA [Escherichia coli]|nr:YcjA [Escherichia coli]